MLKRIILTIVLIISIVSLGITQTIIPKLCLQELGPEFKGNVFQHIQNLAGLGIREAGTEANDKAIAYIKQQLEKTGLKVKVEPFEFEYFVLEKAVLQIEEEILESMMLGFNPYDHVLNLKAEIIFVDPDEPGKAFQNSEIKDKILVTTEPANYFQLAYKNPKVIVFIENSDFQRLKDQSKLIADLTIHGTVQKLKTANVVATLALKSDTTREIILSAHLDSYNGPGADDNGSGIGVLLELAKYFSNFRDNVPWSLKFVAFGGEEVGMVGSRVYIENHPNDLQNCELLFNMDTIGGSKGIYIEMRGGIRNVSNEKGKSQFPEQLTCRTANDFTGKWKLLHSKIMAPYAASNIPEWLKETILTSCKELEYEIIPARQMGSDHRMFAQAGIVSTNIAISGNKHHCAEDKPEQINLESLQKAGNIVARVVWRTMFGIQ